MKSNNSTLSVHIRRFDFLKNQKKLWRLIISLELLFLIFIILPKGNKISTIVNYKIKELLHPTTEHSRICTLRNKYLKIPEIYTASSDVNFNGCSMDNVWVTCHSSKCSVKRSVLRKYKNLECQYSEILYDAGEEFVYSKFEKFIKSFNLIKSDFAYVNCSINNTVYLDDVVFGVRKMVKSDKGKPPFYNVVLYGIGSISHDEFLYKFNETYKYVQDELNGVVLEAYNSPGSTTWDTLIPILSGFSSESLKRVKHSESPEIKFIWETYHDNGFITSFNEMSLDNSIMAKYLKNKPPPDHYMKMYHTVNLNRKYTRDLCSEHNIKDYTRQILTSNKDQPKFIINFGDNQELKTNTKNEDKELKDWIRNLHDSNILKNTIFILMSDNGRQDWTNFTMRLKLDRNLPFFAIILPKTFRHRFSSYVETLIKNSNFLTSPADIHATLLHLLEMQSDKSVVKPSERSISLFSNKMLNSRNCRSLNISHEYCSCFI